jgi:RNA polymerase sigma-70 factor, ECF subfamily
MLYSFDHHHLKDLPQLAPGEPTDEQLLAAIQARDETALAQLKRRHEALLRSIVGRMINNDCDVDDLVQEIMLAVWDHAAGYDSDKGKALGWLITLARRRTIDRIRRKSAYSRARERYREETCCLHDDMHTGADEEAAQGDTAVAVAGIIEHLPPAQREVIELTFYRGLSQRQIAATTGIPLGTIKTRIELALRKLRTAAFAFGEFRDRHTLAHA